MNAKIKVYTGTALTLSLLLTILKTLCFLFSFDSALGYFDNTFLVSLTGALTWISAIWCISVLLLFPKDTVATKKNRSSLLVTAAIIASLLFIAAGVGIFVTNLSNKLAIACGALLFVGSSFFWLHLTRLDRSKFVWPGMLSILGLLAVLVVSHFDMFVAINSPIKLGLHLSAILAALCLLAELRLSFGDEMPRASFALKLLAVLFCLPTAVSHVVLYFSGKAPALSEKTLSPFFSLVLLAIAVYAAARIFAVTDAKEILEDEKENEEEKEIEEI